MYLMNLTPLNNETDFKLQKGNCGSIGATKIDRLDCPIDIVIQNGHTIIAYDTEKYITFRSIITASRAIGKSKQSISSVALGRRPTSHGYFWKYLNKT